MFFMQECLQSACPSQFSHQAMMLACPFLMRLGSLSILAGLLFGTRCITVVPDSSKKRTHKYRLKAVKGTSGPEVENLPSMCGMRSSIPGEGTRIPRAVGQPGPSATARVERPQRKVPHDS